jgi:ribosomal protein S18 acetylase RimI-like enzyme
VKDGLVIAYVMLIPETGYIAQFAVDPEYRRQGIGSRLFSFLPTLIHKPINCINIDANAEATISFMKKIGMQETVRQYEMIMPLDNEQH